MGGIGIGGPMGGGGMDFMGGGMGCMGGMGAMAAFGGVANEAMFKAALQSGGMEQPNSQLLLLLPAELLRQVLVPRGHLQEIAEKCGIRIDCAEVPPNMCQVA